MSGLVSYHAGLATAAEFLAGEPRGQGTDVRLDVALVDASGRVRIVENVVFD